MNYYLPKTSMGYDIAFCSSDCKKTDCQRNKESKLFQRMQEDMKKYNGFYSMARFEENCESYESH